MIKKNIEFQMINDSDKTVFKTVGMLVENTLSFMDQDKQENSVIFKENQVEYIKKGDRFMHYTFDENQTTKGVYQIDQFEFIFQIQTTYMDITEDTIRIDFTLQQDDEIVGHHQLTITYLDDEEE